MSELEIQENMSAEEAFMDTENAYEEIPEAFQKLAQLLGQDQFELLFPDKDVENQDEMRLVYLMNDAVESFLVFSGARMTGHYQKDYEGELDATLSPSALDPEMINEVLDVMVELAREGMTMMVVTHEMGFARKVADRVIFMEAGEILEDAKKEEFFSSPRSERAQQFLSKILSH